MKIVVVGGGITGLTLAFELREGARRRGRDIDVVVLEAESSPGGHVGTLRDDGFLVETGPNGFLDRPREPEVMELMRRLGLESRVIEANRSSSRRFVLHRGRLRRVPDSPATLLGTDALSMRGKLRLLGEPWVRATREANDETVFDFACRRVGIEAAEVLVDAAISGISAGESRRLSLRDAFPKMAQMEREHGSLIRAQMALAKHGRTRLVSFKDGMETPIAALRERLGLAMRTGSRVRGVEREGRRWRLTLEEGHVTADRVVFTIQATRAARLLSSVDSALARTLCEFPYAGIAMVALAYRRADVGATDGYGYLVSRGEGLSTLGVLWESSIFEGRAGADTVLLRVMMGGARSPEVVQLPEAELVRRARLELTRPMGISANPLRSWVRRWPQAIAQYHVGHRDRVNAARALAATYSGLELCGTSYDGVSFTAGVQSALHTADRLLAEPERAPSSRPRAHLHRSTGREQEIRSS